MGFSFCRNFGLSATCPLSALPVADNYVFDVLSFAGRKEKALSMPDIEILARIANVLNVNADYLIGRTNTTAQKGKMKTVCEFTGLSDRAAEYLSELVMKKDSAKLEIINHLFQELCEDYDFYSYETQNGEEAASSVLGALFLYLERCSDKDSVWHDFIFLQCLGLSFIDHHNILAVTAVSFFYILPEKIRSPA